jgi:glucose/arabinose dehydrogenase
MKRIGIVVFVLLAMVVAALAQQPPAKPAADRLKNPHALVVGTDGRVYAAVSGDAEKEGAGAVLVLQDGKAVPFATGFTAPWGLAAYLEWLFVADREGVWRIDRKGKATLFAPNKAFPEKVHTLLGLTADPESGTLYVSDVGDRRGTYSALYRITPQGKVSVVTDGKRWPDLRTATGVVLDGASHLLVLDGGVGELRRVKLADGSAELVARDLGNGGNLAWDRHGRLFITDAPGGRVFVIGRPGNKPVRVPARTTRPAAICLDPSGKSLLVADETEGSLLTIPAQVPGAEVEEAPLPIATEVAFPDLKWAGWKLETDSGKLQPFRPIVLTHAGDGSNRVFVATEQGVVHVFPNDDRATKSKVFLDIRDRVVYDDQQNEEGFLGLAFHPDYKKNGEFFVFYTLKKPKLTNVVSRFRVRKDDPDQADPASEEELLRLPKPYWNHNGGTICFGPDGHLYIAVGDGGLANDPHENGQNLKSLLGKVLRIDVNHKDEGKAYAVPRDNPFVKRPEARGEIWAYGLRNVWRMAFDRQTGKLWASDVGQNLYEEIDILTAGGNYGWNLREGLHPFGAKGVGPRPDLIDPIWEYHHDVGKSLTGGTVYRGKRLPELDGMYLYGDYVTAKLWALRYDATQKRVTANRPIRDRNQPVYSFGEDEQGEVYLLTQTNTGQGVFRFVRTEEGKAPSKP